MEICCRENDYAVGKKAINPAVLWTDPTNMIEKYLCNHTTVSKFNILSHNGYKNSNFLRKCMRICDFWCCHPERSEGSP